VEALLLLLLLQRSLLPVGIILQGVLFLQGSMSVFACQFGLLAYSDSVFGSSLHLVLRAAFTVVHCRRG
jgi:hypothetical protein